MKIQFYQTIFPKGKKAAKKSEKTFHELLKADPILLEYIHKIRDFRNERRKLKAEVKLNLNNIDKRQNQNSKYVRNRLLELGYRTKASYDHENTIEFNF